VLNQYRYKYETKQMRNACISFGKPEGRSSVGRQRDTWENIRRILKKYNARMWIGLN
jgi:hypothetical protein